MRVKVQCCKHAIKTVAGSPALRGGGFWTGEPASGPMNH